jgi:hypothetical protein
MTLTADNAKALTRLFMKIDTDNSGTLDIYEICAFWKKITFGKVDINPQMFADDFKKVGKSMGAKLSPQECIHFLVDAACAAACLLADIAEA